MALPTHLGRQRMPVLDLAVVELGLATLIGLTGSADISAVPPAGITAVHVVASLTSTLTTIYAILVPALGILLLGIADRRAGPSGRPAFGVALAVGDTALLAVAGPVLAPGLGTLAVLTSVLTIAWLVLVGARMIRRRAA